MKSTLVYLLMNGRAQSMHTWMQRCGDAHTLVQTNKGGGGGGGHLTKARENHEKLGSSDSFDPSANRNAEQSQLCPTFLCINGAGIVFPEFLHMQYFRLGFSQCRREIK